MAKVNKHGYKMQGLKKASGETKNACMYGPYVQIAYNVVTGEIAARYHVSVNSYTAWGNYWVHVANAKQYMTMQEIADAAAYAMGRYNYNLREYGMI